MGSACINNINTREDLSWATFFLYYISVYMSNLITIIPKKITQSINRVGKSKLNQALPILLMCLIRITSAKLVTK
jgi:hypothetical protein